jgi:hypothetical protein
MDAVEKRNLSPMPVIEHIFLGYPVRILAAISLEILVIFYLLNSMYVANVFFKVGEIKILISWKLWAFGRPELFLPLLELPFFRKDAIPFSTD